MGSTMDSPPISSSHRILASPIAFAESMNHLLRTALLLPARLLPALLLALFASALPAQEAADPARVIIVFDASGSMAGPIEGRPKIEVAKEVVAGIVSGIDPKVELGLMAYGHRKKGDCGDIELLVPPAAASGATVLSRLAELKPIGKTPLTAAVIEAAGHLRYVEEKASVILVSDGEETCGKDPCTIAVELEAAGLDFTCHVIGFDLKPGESIGLECLAKETGGLYLFADTAKGLMDALQEALKQVMEPVSRLVVEPKLASGGPLVDGASFKLLDAGGKELADGRGGRWSPELPGPGRYQLLAERDDKALKFDLEIASGATHTQEVVFTETGVKARASEVEGGPAIESGLVWTIFGPADAAGERKTISYSYEAAPFLRVDAGTYLLQAERGGAVAKREIEVGDAAPVEVALVLGSGTLKLAAVSKEGEAPLSKDLSWEILGEPDAEGDRPRQAYSYDAQPNLAIPSGKYLVAVGHGSARAQKEVEVVAGQTTEAVLSLESGTLKASALSSEGAPPIESGLAWNVLGEADLEGNRPSVAYSYDPQPSFSLPSGKYLLQVSQGSAEASKEIEIGAAGTTEAVLILGSGRLRVSALPAEGAKPLADGLSWNLLSEADLTGHRESVAYSYDPEPTLTVPAGKYLLTLEWGAAKTQREVSIDAGKLTEIALILGAGTIQADAVMGEGGAPIPDGVAWTLHGVSAAGGELSDAGFSYDAAPLFRNNAGKYRVRVKRGSAEAEAEVEVVANKQTRVTLNLKAGVLQVKTKSEGMWSVLGEPADGDDDPVDLGFSYDKDATFILPAGKVVVRRIHNDKTAEKTVEIGVNQSIEVALELD